MNFSDDPTASKSVRRWLRGVGNARVSHPCTPALCLHQPAIVHSLVSLNFYPHRIQVKHPSSPSSRASRHREPSDVGLAWPSTVILSSRRCASLRSPADDGGTLVANSSFILLRQLLGFHTHDMRIDETRKGAS